MDARAPTERPHGGAPPWLRAPPWGSRHHEARTTMGSMVARAAMRLAPPWGSHRHRVDGCARHH
eukprot:434252-Pyramimonas_sp.AAC.1